MDKIAAAAAELAAIEARTAARQREQSIDDKRKAELQTLFAILDTIGYPKDQRIAGAVEPAHKNAPTAIAQPRPAGRKEEILAAAELALEHSSMHTRDLIDVLKNVYQITIGGKDPVQNLSVYLSREKDRFKSDRALGWTLIRPHKEMSPQGAATPADSGLWDSVKPASHSAPETAPDQSR